MSLRRLLALSLILIFTPDVTSHSSCKMSRTSPPWRKFLIPSLFPHVPPYVRFARRSECQISLPATIRQELLWGKTIRQSDIVRTHEVLRRTGFAIVPRTTRSKIFQMFDRYDNSNLIEDKKNPIFTSAEMKLNHLPNILELDDKILFSKNQKRFISKFGEADFPYVIPTFIIPDEQTDFFKLCKASRTNFWVQKPSNLSEAAGVRFFSNCDQLDQSVSIVQQYVQKPLIFLGRKLELRKYATVTGFDPLRIFVVNDEFMKLSTKNYTEDPIALSDICVHTPWSPRCKRNLFGPEPYGHFTSTMKEYFKDSGIDLVKIRKQMEDVIIKSFLSAQKSIVKASYKSLRSTYNAYNFVAFDFLVDQSGHLWLNEMNRSPGLGFSTGPRIQNVIASQLTIAGYNLPSNLSPASKKLVLRSLSGDLDLNDPTFDRRLYLLERTIGPKERQYTKHPPKNRSNLLQNMTPTEVRQLILAEDELNRLQHQVKCIFPSRTMHKYFKYIEYKPYYYWLFSAWEKQYGGNRSAGIEILRTYAQKKAHLRL